MQMPFALPNWQLCSRLVELAKESLAKQDQENRVVRTSAIAKERMESTTEATVNFIMVLTALILLSTCPGVVYWFEHTAYARSYILNPFR